MLAASKNRRHGQPRTRAHRRARGKTCTSDFKTCIQRRRLCAALSSHGKPRCKHGHDYEVAQVVMDYTFGHDEISQRVVTDDGQGGTTDETHIFGHDGHGSVRVLYDLAGTAASIAQAFTFSAYGEMIALHNATAQSIAVTERLSSLGYSGEHFDAKAAQQYLRARFYNPANGRFNRLDPFAGNMQDPQSLHKYAYVHGDPIQGTDPTGLSFNANVSISGMQIAIGIGAVVVGYLSFKLLEWLDRAPVGAWATSNGLAVPVDIVRIHSPATAFRRADKTQLEDTFRNVQDFFYDQRTGIQLEINSITSIASASDSTLDTGLFGWAEFLHVGRVVNGNYSNRPVIVIVDNMTQSGLTAFSENGFVTDSRVDWQIWAHELGHVYGLEHYYNPTQNIMKDGLPTTRSGVFFSNAQIGIMRGRIANNGWDAEHLGRIRYPND